MTTRLKNIFLSRFFLWLLLAAVGGYFLVAWDAKTNRFHMPRLKLGIDLQGGTYLVLGVEVEKAVQSRLDTELKELDTLFNNKNPKALPVKREVKDLAINLTYSDAEAAKIGYNFIKREVKTLNVTLVDTLVRAVLTPVEEQRIRSGSVEQGVSVLQNRLNNFGVSGLIVQRHGERQIVVQLPGLDDPERVKNVITKTAHLEFKIVEREAGSKEAILDDFDGDLPADKMVIPGVSSGMPNERRTWYLVSRAPDLTGDHIVDANVGFDQYNAMIVNFQLDSSGARDFGVLTGENRGRNLGIIIDNEMYQLPRISTEISGGKGYITTSGNIEEAQDLALVLRSGSLLAPISFEQETRVGASLGRDSIENGILSCLVGLALLLLFSLLYYRLIGFFAILALFYNLFLILAFLAYFEATLTLPGIAGMVLTIGMAIDASILIYERIREVIAEGVPLRKAIDEGFSGAMVVILDSNVTTFLTGLVLFKFGGPAIKGFAVTLMAGIVATILSGVYFLKSIFTFMLDNTRKRFVHLK